jgi:uncharacterized protein YlxW (UPF0749 family)
MSTPSRGGGPRSMGASLLDAVLAETLDPAYAQAAAARTATPAGAPVRPRWRGRTLVALTMAIAGLLVAVTYDQAAAGAKGREQVRAALIDDIDRESGVSDDLELQLRDLNRTVTTTRDQMLAATAGGQRALEELATAERGAAAQQVTGPGLLVTLANADPTADEDPVGGSTEQDPREKVQDGDLQLVVNALWAAGAEAISINGQRLGPTTAIRFAGEAVLVDFRPVTSPYEVSAIGDLHTLRDKFVLDPRVQALASLSLSLGLRFDLASKDELTLRAASTPDLRSAVFDGPEPADAGASGTTGATPSATTTDPTPGG